MKKFSALLLGACWLAAGVPALGEGPPSDPVAAALIAPEVVMGHQEALGLTETQRHDIQTDAQNAQRHFTTLQWQLSAASEKLVGLLNATHVDQPRAIAALDTVLGLERELKHTQLTLMIQIKNELTPEQQARARRFVSAK